MQQFWSSPRASVLAALFLGLLLVVLGLLQYRWIAQLSEVERRRLEDELARAAAAIGESFDRELARTALAFELPASAADELPASLLVEHLESWRAEAPHPELISEIALIRRQDQREPSLFVLEETPPRLRSAKWEGHYVKLRRFLHELRPGRVALPELPGLLVPIARLHRSDASWQPPRDHLVLRFDREILTEEFLASLVNAQLAHGGRLQHSVIVAPLGRPGEALFQAGPSPSTVGRGDASCRFFSLRQLRIESFSSPGPYAQRPAAGPGRRPPPRGNPPRRQSAGTDDAPAEVPVATGEAGAWLLTVHHPAGSLEEAVTQARRRNLALSLVTLVLLAATILLMLRSSRRAEELARLQLDFVAAVSHELRTPLTAIRSAGQNLADGIIDEPQKIRRYGLLIEGEGRRLTEMIARVLSFAGIRSGHLSLRQDAVSLAELVQGVLDDARWVLEERGIELERQIAADLPPVKGDATALRQVLSNLVDNAIKYGARGGWIGVGLSLEESPRGGMLVFSVSDRGPGVPRKDRDQIFEAFRRAGAAGSSRIPGSGLGLAVVRSIANAHGGEVRLVCPSAGGARFELRLPAMMEGDA